MIFLVRASRNGRHAHYRSVRSSAHADEPPMDKGFADTLLDADPVRPEKTKIYRQQTDAFRRKFGREMGPEDPFFFDPDADTPQFRSPQDADLAIDLLAQLMGEAGVDAAAIYAFK